MKPYISVVIFHSLSLSLTPFLSLFLYLSLSLSLALSLPSSLSISFLSLLLPLSIFVNLFARVISYSPNRSNYPISIISMSAVCFDFIYVALFKCCLIVHDCIDDYHNRHLCSNLSNLFLLFIYL